MRARWSRLMTGSVSFSAVFLALATVALPARAEVIHVSVAGDDAYSCAQAHDPATPRRTITAGILCVGGGIAGAGAGHTVVVEPGVYEEAIWIIPGGASWS